MKHLIIALLAALAFAGCADTTSVPAPAAPSSSDQAPPTPEVGSDPVADGPLVLTARVPKGDPTARQVQVKKVTDGDTIDVTDSTGDTYALRILGIDTPETKKPRTPVRCGGPEASAYAAQVFPVGSKVTVAGDPTQPSLDRYGRTLVYVSEPSGQDYSLDVLARGGGRFAEYGPKITRHSQYQTVWQAARDGHRGIYGPPCNGNSF